MLSSPQQEAYLDEIGYNIPPAPPAESVDRTARRNKLLIQLLFYELLTLDSAHSMRSSPDAPADWGTQVMLRPLHTVAQGPF